MSRGEARGSISNPGTHSDQDPAPSLQPGRVFTDLPVHTAYLTQHFRRTHEECKTGAKLSARNASDGCSQCATHLDFNTQCLWILCVCSCFHSGRPWGERSAWLDPRTTARICPQKFQSLWIRRWGALLGEARKDPIVEEGWRKEKPTQQSLGSQPQAQ